MAQAEQIGIIIAINLALYLKTLRYRFVSDDFTVWKNPPVYKSRLHKWWLRFIGATKYLNESIHFLRVNGKNRLAIVKTEEMDHLITVLIHTLICTMIYIAFGANQVSFIASLFYSCNPVNNQGTIWPGGRGYALPILSLLSAVALPILSPVLLFFCASFTVGFLYPLALIGSECYWMLLIMLVVWPIIGRKFVRAVKNKQKTETFTEDKLVHPKKLILAVKSFGFYLTLCLTAFKITFYHNFLQSAAGSMAWKSYTLCRYFWIGFIGMCSMIAYAILVPWNTLTWALFAFSISIAPFCNLVRANQETAERFAAPANVFLMYALAQLITPYPVLIAAILAFYATRTFYTLKMYTDEYWITEISVAEDSAAWWCWHCRAMKAFDRKSLEEALTLWVMAKLISPKEYKVLMNIASCLRKMGNHEEADKYLELAEKNIVPGQEEQAKDFIKAHRDGKLPIIL